MIRVKRRILWCIAGVVLVLLIVGVYVYSINRQKVLNEAYNGSADEKYYYSEFSVNVLKEKYGYKNNIFPPIYNVAQTGEFNIQFNCSDDLPDDAISVHTDIECNPESEIETYKWVKKSDRYTRNVEIKPYNMVLSDKAGVGWGNAPVYYIRINYSPYNKNGKLAKLEQPIIIPFKVQSEVTIPTLGYSVDDTGIFSLIWNEVKGATGYNIYQIKKLQTDVVGRKSSYYGYSYDSPKLIATVDKDTLKWCGWNNDGNNGLGKVNDEVTLYQNYGLGGEYYVTALKGESESLFSNTVSVGDYADILPYRAVDEDNGVLKNGSYVSNVKELPRSIEVDTINGKAIDYSINYKIDESTRYSDNVYYNYNIRGTGLTGYIEVKVEDVASLPESINNGVNTFCDNMKLGFYNTKSTSATKDSTNLNDYILRSKHEIEEADKNDIVNGGLESILYKVNADNAIEDYIASNLIRYKTMISLDSFPEVQDYTVLIDYIQKVLYQNPMILGVKNITYSEDAKELIVEYDKDIADLKSDQRKLYDRVQQIVPLIIDGKTAEDVVSNIYSWINQSCTYDKESGLLRLVEEGKGNAIAYSKLFKLISDEVGVKSIIISGSLNGKLHTWNGVENADRWYYIDCTNNYKNTGLEYICYNMSSNFAESIGYLANNKFCLDGQSYLYESTRNDLEYYNKNGLVATNQEQYFQIVSDELKKGKDIIAVRYSGLEIPSSKIVDEVSKIYENSDKKKLLANLKFGDGLGYYILWEDKK